MLARRPKSAQAIAMRARIVLACAEGLSNGTAAKKLHITGATEDADLILGKVERLCQRISDSGH
jgi:hypothetical protein